MDNIKKIRETTAKLRKYTELPVEENERRDTLRLYELRETLGLYMGWKLQRPNKYYSIGHWMKGKDFKFTVDSWKPDENSSQADMVEDKLDPDQVRYKRTVNTEPMVGAVWYNYKMYFPKYMVEENNPSKKLARALALEKAINSIKHKTIKS